MTLETFHDVIQFYADQQCHEYRTMQLVKARLTVCCIGSGLWSLLAFNLVQPLEISEYYANVVMVLLACFAVMMAGNLHFIIRAFILPKFKKMPTDLKKAPKVNGKLDVARYLQQVPDFNRTVNDMKAHMIDRSCYWLIGSYIPIGLILLIGYFG